jgi:hypothetical protein
VQAPQYKEDSGVNVFARRSVQLPYQWQGHGQQNHIGDEVRDSFSRIESSLVDALLRDCLQPGARN